MYLIVTICAFPHLMSQPESREDSLKTILATATGKQQLETLISLSALEVCKFSKSNNCVEYARAAKSLALELNDPSAYIRAMLKEGEAMADFGNKKGSIDTIQKAVTTALEYKMTHC